MPLVQPHVCDRCHRPVDLRIGATGHTGELRTSAWYTCSHCHQSMEADGLVIDPATRQAMLAAEGKRGLRVDEEGERALRVAQQLRALLDIPMVEAMAMRRRMPGVVFEGLAAECEWLAIVLKRAGWKALLV